VRFDVLGPFRIRSGDGGDASLPPRHRALLAALLVARGHPVPAERLQAEVWPGGAPATASAALQVYVSGLRKVVGERLRTTPAGYLLDVPDSAVDAREFERLLTAPGDRAATLGAAIALWHGPAFDGVAAGPSVAAAAARLSERLLGARQEWAELALAAGRSGEVLAELTGWVTEHPAAERLVAPLMLALHRAGRTGEALAAYGRAEAALAGLGTRPGTGLAALAEAIRRHDPTLLRPGPGLPAGRNRFIGRRVELDRAIALLGTNRLLTMAGPGGSGKTRLGLELVREVADEHPGGAYVVELAGLATGTGLEALTARVAAAVGAREAAGATITESLTGHLGAGRALLLLDNCEHVRADAAALADHLLAACPGVRIVTTSREPLGLPGEIVQPLAGLALPAPGAPAADLARSDAVRLLADRIAAARGGVALSRAEEPLAAELCRRLDGLPLALELAAARLRALSLPEIVTRLDRRLDLLVGQRPEGRHRTMRAAIDWGHELLDEPQRVLLRRLSVFAGGFGLAAAQRVGADPDGMPPHAPDAVLDPLLQLVDRSLVAADRSPAERPTIEATRYRLIETIREYAVERLATAGAPGEQSRARDRHARLWADLLEAPPPADGPAHAAWLATVGTEYDNIRAALEWTLDGEGDAELGLTIAAAMWWYWWVTGRMVEGRSWLSRALRAAPAGATPLRGRALRVAASLARNNGDLTAARYLGEQGLATFRRLSDRAGIIGALNNLSITAQGQGDFDASLGYGDEGLRMAEQDGNARAIAVALNNTAGTLRCLNRLDEAAPLFTRALAGFREIGERRGEAAALANLSIVDRRRDALPSARTRMTASLRLYTELEIAEGQVDAIEALAQLEILEHRPAEGLALLALADRERTALGAPIFTPDEAADRDTAETRARAALTPAEIAEAYRRATATTLTEAVTAALTPADASRSDADDAPDPVLDRPAEGP
jgi:predicted ATPase/DNA-binding SARP family transcriptional activator